MALYSVYVCWFRIISSQTLIPRNFNGIRIAKLGFFFYLANAVTQSKLIMNILWYGSSYKSHFVEHHIDTVFITINRNTSLRFTLLPNFDSRLLNLCSTNLPRIRILKDTGNVYCLANINTRRLIREVPAHQINSQKSQILITGLNGVFIINYNYYLVWHGQ